MNMFVYFFGLVCVAVLCFLSFVPEPPQEGYIGNRFFFEDIKRAWNGSTLDAVHAENIVRYLIKLQETKKGEAYDPWLRVLKDEDWYAKFQPMKASNIDYGTYAKQASRKSRPARARITSLISITSMDRARNITRMNSWSSPRLAIPGRFARSVSWRMRTA